LYFILFFLLNQIETKLYLNIILLRQKQEKEAIHLRVTYLKSKTLR